MDERSQILRAIQAATQSRDGEIARGQDDSPRPEWLRPNEVRYYFGIGRTRTYEIIGSGKVRTVSLRKRGQKHGTRLINYDSLANYLNSIAEGGEP